MVGIATAANASRGGNPGYLHLSLSNLEGRDLDTQPMYHAHIKKFDIHMLSCKGIYKAGFRKLLAESSNQDWNTGYTSIYS
jgi:hypothetical protein